MSILARKKRARTALDREAKPEVGQSAAVTSEISASPKTFEVCGRKVRISGSNQGMYKILRSWVYDNPDRPFSPKQPAEPPQALPQPLAHSQGAFQRLKPEPRTTTPKEDILHAAKGIDAEILLNNHITYFRQLKQWFALNYRYKQQRYTERLRLINLHVVPISQRELVGTAALPSSSTQLPVSDDAFNSHATLTSSFQNDRQEGLYPRSAAFESPARTRDGTFSEGGESLLHLADATMAMSPGGFSGFHMSPHKQHGQQSAFSLTHGTPGRTRAVDTHAHEDLHSAEALMAMASPARPPSTKRHPITALQSSDEEDD